MAHKFEVYKDKAGEFRVRFKYNSEVIFSTEGYSDKSGARRAIEFDQEARRRRGNRRDRIVRSLSLPLGGRKTGSQSGSRSPTSSGRRASSQPSDRCRSGTQARVNGRNQVGPPAAGAISSMSSAPKFCTAFTVPRTTPS
ncbi:hypothetical protein MMB232_00523 [Brevundimonas subvibrioides]